MMTLLMTRFVARNKSFPGCGKAQKAWVRQSPESSETLADLVQPFLRLVTEFNWIELHVLV